MHRPLRRLLTVSALIVGFSTLEVNDTQAGRLKTALHCGPKYRNSGGDTAYQMGTMYAHPQWGTPVALVVPPRAASHVEYSWGVPSSRRVAIDKHFPDSGIVGGMKYPPAPVVPTDTTQFGVYPLRVPREYGH